jgi:hypothetical protein
VHSRRPCWLIAASIPGAATESPDVQGSSQLAEARAVGFALAVLHHCLGHDRGNRLRLCRGAFLERFRSITAWSASRCWWSFQCAERSAGARPGPLLSSPRAVSRDERAVFLREALIGREDHPLE